MNVAANKLPSPILGLASEYYSFPVEMIILTSLTTWVFYPIILPIKIDPNKQGGTMSNG